MGFRFRKTISLFPGLRLNISKGGISTSLGRPGASINIGKQGVRGTVGLPGSGLSYSEMLVRRRTGSAGSDYEVDTGSASGSPVKRVMFFAVVVVLAVAAVLSIAGLMSARQTPTINLQARPNVPRATDDRVDRVSDETASERPDHVSSANAANCRSNPNARASIVTVLSGNERLNVMDRQGDWSRVTDDMHDCWISSRLVR
ncbi:DUF4236 domain-containing protein [Sphingomonas sp. R86521]|uniref:DUF4236 domain-containing protein n=1 Tax=Sphingomonas sp. R86521 TaxID=3093860 RepID=UPI0036D21B91